MNRIIIVLSLFCFPISGSPASAEESRSEAKADVASPTVPRTRSRLRVKLTDGDASAAARVTVTGSDGKSYAPAGAALRRTKRGESYFYAENSFDIELPPGRARFGFDGGLETIPLTITTELDAGAGAELTASLRGWIDLEARGWYSGDSHVHLHTGGPIDVKVADALTAARAEGVNYVNLCVSNNVGDDIRDAELITGKPHSNSTNKHLLVFGEEMRSSIYGHMQFFGINKLVEPQYTGFDATPNRNDYPANHVMAAEAVRQGGLVTYGHPMFAGEPFPFGPDPTKDNAAARELPIDVALGLVHAVDLMSYNSDENLSAELWYRLLNCGFKLSACVGTDALLDRSTDPMGGDRVYVKPEGPFTMQSWIDGLKRGRSFVTNGPIPTLEVDGKGPGETRELPGAGKVRVSATVESLAPFDRIEVLVNGKLVRGETFEGGSEMRLARLELDVPLERSSWIALRVRGPESSKVFDGPAWAHTSPVYVNIADKPAAIRQDAEYFIGWIDQLLKVVETRNRYGSPEDRRRVESVFRKARDEFRRLAAVE